MALTRPSGVPDAEGAEDTQAEPFDVRRFPAVPGLVSPVPPLAADNAPVNVLLANAIVLFVSVAVLVAVSTLVGVMIEDSVVMYYSGLTQDVVASSHEYIPPSVGIGVGGCQLASSSSVQLWYGCGGMNASRTAL